MLTLILSQEFIHSQAQDALFLHRLSCEHISHWRNRKLFLTVNCFLASNKQAERGRHFRDTNKRCQWVNCPLILWQTIGFAVQTTISIKENRDNKILRIRGNDHLCPYSEISPNLLIYNTSWHKSKSDDYALNTVHLLPLSKMLSQIFLRSTCSIANRWRTWL